MYYEFCRSSLSRHSWIWIDFYLSGSCRQPPPQPPLHTHTSHPIAADAGGSGRHSRVESDSSDQPVWGVKRCTFQITALPLKAFGARLLSFPTGTFISSLLLKAITRRFKGKINQRWHVPSLFCRAQRSPVCSRWRDPLCVWTPITSPAWLITLIAVSPPAATWIILFLPWRVTNQSDSAKSIRLLITINLKMTLWP